MAQRKASFFKPRVHSGRFSSDIGLGRRSNGSSANRRDTFVDKGRLAFDDNANKPHNSSYRDGAAGTPACHGRGGRNRPYPIASGASRSACQRPTWARRNN